jgi:hypothetical protein
MGQDGWGLLGLPTVGHDFEWRSGQAGGSDRPDDPLISCHDASGACSVASLIGSSFEALRVSALIDNDRRPDKASSIYVDEVISEK